MAWPPSLPASFITNGTGSTAGVLRWGTDGVCTNFATAIVKSVRLTDQVEEIKIENGTGFTAQHIMLIDGRDCEITCVDDTVGAWPNIGMTVQVYDPFGNGVTQYSYRVVNNNYNMARKDAGERVLLAKRFTLAGP